MKRHFPNFLTDTLTVSQYSTNVICFILAEYINLCSLKSVHCKMKTVQKCSDKLNLPYIFGRSLIVSHLQKTFYSTVSLIFMFIVTFNLKLANATTFISTQYYISEIPLTIADNWMEINIITMISVSWWYLDFCRACCSSNDNSSCLEGKLPEFVTFVSFLTLAHTGGF